MIKVKRVYDEVESDDGKRFLVERLWPRGIKRESMKLDDWLKDVAPSTELRKWFGHEPEKWEEFKKRYLTELEDKKRYVEVILNAAKNGNVTLLYSAKDKAYNGAIVLKDYIESLNVW
jgi:uncharacterized protein YeaO (DUF488 family)